MEAHLTQEELAERSGVSVRAIADAESGRTKRPQRRSVQMLADGLGLAGPERAALVAFSRGQRGDLGELIRPGASEHPDQPAGGQIVALHQLPAAVAPFVGRTSELAALTDLLVRTCGTAGTIVISAIAGTAGVGKTALAVYWAHQVADRFGDGQLHVNLRGYDPGQPASAADALARFLRDLGVPDRDIPVGEDERAARYRSLLAGKRMLILLDNAGTVDQVRPLLPASPGSLVLVTSRSQLGGLAAADGARLISLDVLTHAEAVQLLTARLGSARAAAEPTVVDQIARLCACLPLALTVAAARAAARPRMPLAALAAELADAAGRLDALDTGDTGSSVRAVFSWSTRQLSDTAARMFRLLGLHPGPDISATAAASLTDSKEPQARRLLGELARAHLITEHVPGRYAFHDLLRTYAAEKAWECDSEKERDAAISRVLDHYLHTAVRAALLLRPGREPLVLAAPKPGAAPEQLGDYRKALAWFDAEHHVLLTAVTFAADVGADAHAWQLPSAMTEYLYRQGHLHEGMATLDIALAAATRLDDSLGQAMSLRRLGLACTETGNYDQARAHLERCLPLYHRLDDRRGEAMVQQSLSRLAEIQGLYTDALGHGERALHLYRATGQEIREAQMLGGVAWCHALVGDYQKARAFCEQSLALIAKLGGGDFEYNVRDTLGYIELHLGDFAQAAAHFEFALGLCRDHGHRSDEAEILTHVGDARHAAGELPQARQAWQQALAIFDDIQHPDAEKVRAKLADTEN